MKKTILISTLALLLFSCGKTDDKTIESILASKNIAQISAKKSELQAQIAQLEEALKALDTDRSFLLQGGVFTDNMLDAYIHMKLEEATELNRTPHPLEFKLYYSA
jgi:glutamine synthetase